MTDARLTHDELVNLFGEQMPIEAVTLICECPPETSCDELRERLREIAVRRREEGDFSKMLPAELVEHFERLLSNASPLPWQESWDTKRNGNGWAWMEASGPQTIALKEDDPRFRELIVDRAFADAKLLTDAVNALPRMLDLLASVGRNPEGQDRATGLGRNDEHAVDAEGSEAP